MREGEEINPLAERLSSEKVDLVGWRRAKGATRLLAHRGDAREGGSRAAQARVPCFKFKFALKSTLLSISMQNSNPLCIRRPIGGGRQTARCGAQTRVLASCASSLSILRLLLLLRILILILPLLAFVLRRRRSRTPSPYSAASPAATIDARPPVSRAGRPLML